MPYFESAKHALRISHTRDDAEIVDLIQSALRDLSLAGILPSTKQLESDPLIKRAVLIYVKANYGFSDDESQTIRLLRQYESLKLALRESREYHAEV